MTYTVRDFIKAFSALDPDLPVWFDNSECQSWPAELPFTGRSPVMRKDSPGSVDYYTDGVWLT